MRKLLILTIILNCFLPTCYAEEQGKPAAEVSPEYLKGYVHSLVKYVYSLPENSVFISDHVIYINKDNINNASPENIKLKLEQALSEIKNVKVVIKENKPESIKEAKEQPPQSGNILADGLMPSHSLFEPLIADPKWPRFTLAYHYQSGKKRHNKHFFAPNFGATIPLYRHSNKYDWEIGIQGGLFGLMDIGTDPTALINADYFIGLPISVRSGPWSGLIRPYHLSSHIGDEFMLTDQGKNLKRINLSYEGIDALASYNISGLRLYGGGGYIVHKEPSYYKRGKIQLGSEYYATTTLWDGRLRPVGAVDLKFQEHNNWYPGVSIKGGVQLENSILMSNKVLLMLEYYSGKSFHGQFYNDKLRYIGLGLQVFM